MFVVTHVSSYACAQPLSEKIHQNLFLMNESSQAIEVKSYMDLYLGISKTHKAICNSGLLYQESAFCSVTEKKLFSQRTLQVSQLVALRTQHKITHLNVHTTRLG